MTSSVLGEKFKIIPRPLLHHRQFADSVKAQAYCLRLGRLTPKGLSKLESH
jgi:hypothetical protein